MVVFKIIFLSANIQCVTVKKNKDIDCVISWKSKGVYSSIISLQLSVF